MNSSKELSGPSTIEQKAIPRRHRYTRAVTGHRDITGSGAQFISRFAPTASGANGAKKSAVSADSIFIDTGKQLGRIYYFTRARAPTRAVVFVCFRGIAFYSRRLYTTAFHTADIFECPSGMAAIFCNVPITFEMFDWSSARRRLNQRDTKLMDTGRSSMVELRKGAARAISPLPSEKFRVMRY